MNFEQEQLESIRYVLNEMAFGNLAYRLKYSGTREDYDTIAMLINLIADSIEDLLSDASVRTPDNSGMASMDFFLTRDFTIDRINEVALDILGREPEQLNGAAFGGLLAEDSLADWDTLKNHVLPHLNTAFCFGLSFHIGPWICCPAYCYFSHAPEKGHIRVSSPKAYTKHTIEDFMTEHQPVKQGKRETKPEIPQPSGKTLRKTAEEKGIRDVADYIDHNLDTPLPPIKELAQMFGMNSKKLKTGFKQLFKTSVYQYYINKRMDRAMNLLRTTDQSVQEVAELLGYRVMSSFYRSFKQKFGHTPGAVKRKDGPPKDHRDHVIPPKPEYPKKRTEFGKKSSDLGIK